MAEQNYEWWVNRAKANCDLYDIIRIDHVRGFASYYAIPAHHDTARNGTWEIGPRLPLFEAIARFSAISMSGAVPFIGSWNTRPKN